MKLRPSRFFKCFHLLRRFREAFASLFATLSTSLLGETSYFEAPYPESPSQTIIQPSRGWMCGILSWLRPFLPFTARRCFLPRRRAAIITADCTRQPRG